MFVLDSSGRRQRWQWRWWQRTGRWGCLDSVGGDDGDCRGVGRSGAKSGSEWIKYSLTVGARVNQKQRSKKEQSGYWWNVEKKLV